MANLDKFKQNPQQELLSQMKGARCVMLGTPHSDAHMQPMTPQIDMDEECIYFFADSTSHLGQAVLEKPGHVHMCYIDDDVQACLKGYLITHKDRSTVDKFWSPVVSAWYPDGKTDSKLMMLKLVPHDASIWASDKNILSFTYEIAKANLTDTQPDLGEQMNIDLRRHKAA